MAGTHGALRAYVGMIWGVVDLPKRRPTPTLRMIADELGLNVSTVSRVLNAPEQDAHLWAAPETEQRIREAARRLDYAPNPYAASLRTSRSNLVGVIVPRLQDFVLATVYEGIEEAAIEKGRATFVTNSLNKLENQRGVPTGCSSDASTASSLVTRAWTTRIWTSLPVEASPSCL